MQRTTGPATATPAIMLGAVLALTFVMHMLARGATEMFAVFLLPVEQALGASRSDISGVYSLFMLVLGLAGPFAGAVFDRLGARAAYGSGLILLGGSLHLAGYATAVWHYMATVGLAAGLGVSLLGMVSANALLSRWYERRLGTAIGLTYAATGFGVLIGAPLAQLLIGAYGWRDAYKLIGLVLLAVAALAIVALPLARLSRGSPAWQQRRAVHEATRGGWDVARAARTPAFWALSLVYFLTSLASFAVSPQSVAAMVEAGLTPLAAASAFGLCGMLSLIGNASIAPLVDRFGQRLMITLSYLGTVIGILSLAALPHYPSLVLVYAWALLFGVNQGTRGPIISTSGRDLVRWRRRRPGLRHYRTWHGLRRGDGLMAFGRPARPHRELPRLVLHGCRQRRHWHGDVLDSAASRRRPPRQPLRGRRF